MRAIVKVIKKIGLVALLLSTIMLLHEIGHAAEMYKRGISIETIKIGIDFNERLPSLIIHPEYLPVSVVKITPLLIGASVEATANGQAKMNSLPYRDYAVIMGGGIWINLVSGLILLSLWLTLLTTKIESKAKYIAVLTGLTIFLLLSRNVFGPYIVPLIGIGLLGEVIRSVIRSVIIKKETGLVGPIGIYRLVYDELSGSSSTKLSGFSSAVRVIGTISLLIGIFNTLVILPMDGGMIINRILEIYSQDLSDKYQSVSTVMMTILLSVILASDFPLIRKRTKS